MDDTALFRTFVATWVHARDAAVTEVDGWPRIHVGAASRETELLCLDPGTAALPRLLEHVAGDPRAMLTILGRDLSPYDIHALPDDVRLDRHDETVMTAALRPLETAPVDPAFTTGWDEHGGTMTYWVASGERIAAEGSVGVLGDHASFDGVETTPRFRRRGLGRHVMTQLVDHALAAGAHHGVLAASGEGQLLYRSIGWQPRLQMRSFMGA